MKPEVEKVLTNLSEAANTLDKEFPSSRELSLVQTKIQEAVLWLSCAPKFETSVNEKLDADENER